MPDPSNEDKYFLGSKHDHLTDEAVWDLLNSYADGECTPTEVAAIDRLLQRNPTLSASLAFIRGTSVAARSIPEVDPPGLLRSSILDATVNRRTFLERVAREWKQICSGYKRSLLTGYALAGCAVAAVGAVLLVSAPRVKNSGEQPSTFALTVPVVPRTGNPSSTPSVYLDDKLRAPQVQPTVAIKTTVQSSETRLQRSLARTDKKMARAAADASHYVIRAVSTPEHASVAFAAVRKPMASAGQSRTGLITAAATVDRTNDQPAAQFSPIPKMDLANQRAAWATVAKNQDDSLGANVDGSRDNSQDQPVSASADRAADSAAPRVIRVSLSQLPPDARHYVTTADLKREIDARNLGYNRMALKGIERAQASVALYTNKF